MPRSAYRAGQRARSNCTGASGGAPVKRGRLLRLALRAHRRRFTETPGPTRKARRNRMGKDVLIKARAADQANTELQTVSVIFPPFEPTKTPFRPKFSPAFFKRRRGAGRGALQIRIRCRARSPAGASPRTGHKRNGDEAEPRSK